MSLVGEKEMRSVRLRLKLKRIGKVVFGWVVYQDESLRMSAGYREKCLASCPVASSVPRFEIQSYRVPQLCKDKLYIRGNYKAGDNNPFAYAYKTEEEARNVYDNIVWLVGEINRASPPESEAPQEAPNMDVVE